MASPSSSPTLSTAPPTSKGDIDLPPPAPTPIDDFDLFKMVEPEARRAGVPLDLAMRVIHQESANNPTARSVKGAIGLMQLMPATAKAYGISDPYDPVQNVRAGMTHLGKLLTRYKGDQRQALADYNGGPAAVQALKEGRTWRETKGYLQGILGNQPGQGVAPPAAAVGTSPPTPTGSIDPNIVDSATSGGQPVDEFEQFRQAHEGNTPQEYGVPGPPNFPGLPGLEKPPNPLQYGNPAGTAHVFEHIISAGANAAEAFDPTTPEGRQNLAGGAGALGVTALSGGTDLPPAAVALLASAGAGLSGGAEAGAEGEDQSAPGVMRKQMLQQALGEIFGMGQARVTNFLQARTVGQSAADYLTKEKQKLIDDVSSRLDAAQGLMQSVRQSASRSLRTARKLGAQAVDAAKEKAGTLVDEAQQQAMAGMPPPAPMGPSSKEAAEAAYAQAGQTPRTPNAQVGQNVNAVIRGPAQRALDMLGQAVSRSAESGPSVNIADLKAAAQRIVDRLMPAAVEFPGKTASEAGEQALPAEVRNLPLSAEQQASVRQQLGTQTIESAQQEAQKDLLKHPIMGTIAKILNAPDEVSFEAAHGFKRLLDDALQGTWDQSVKKQVTGMRQSLRGMLRSTMEAAGHAPYEEATKAYEQVVPLFQKGYAPQLRKMAVDNPDGLVSMVKGFGKNAETTKLSMLRDLLTTQAEAGGGGEQGRAAWGSFRDAWLRQNVYDGGIKGLSKRIGNLNPEFRDVLVGDDEGQGVFKNLQAIADAYDNAVKNGTLDEAQRQVAREEVQQKTATAVSGAKQQGADLVKSAQAQKEGAIENSRLLKEQRVNAEQVKVDTLRKEAQQAAKPSDKEQEFLKSRLAPQNQPSLPVMFSDVLRASIEPLQAAWGNISRARLILETPSSKEMLKWAAHSPTMTKALVQLFNSPLRPTAYTAAGKAVVKGMHPPAPPQMGEPPPSP